MTEAQAQELVVARMVSAWDASVAAAGVSGTIPWARPNKAKLGVDVFAQLLFLQGARSPLDQGSGRRHRQWLNVAVLVFVPANSGSLVIGQLCDAAKRTFEDQALTLGSDQLTFSSGAPRSGANNVDGRWDMRGVQFEPYFFETRVT